MEPGGTELRGLTEMLKGVLEGCVLELIDRGETYGYEITRRLNELGFDEVVEGTVYAILLRFERGGWVEADRRPSLSGPPRKLYRLNDAGRAELRSFWARWGFVASRITRLRED